MDNKKYVMVAVVIWILLDVLYIFISKSSILCFIGFNAGVGAIITVPFIIFARAKVIQKISLTSVSLGYGLVGCALIIADGLKCCNKLWNILVLVGVVNILMGKGVFFISLYKHKETK